MRLINIYTLEFGEFCEVDLPAYFILSHRWGDEEITYKEFARGRGVATRGFQKIEELCAFARIQNEDYALRDSFGGLPVEWVWIDTCCIDKRSSAELSEAINSMFAWYQKAVACFVYLREVTAIDDTYDLVEAHTTTTSPSDDLYYAFIGSSWFQRGWTLQELLAPSRLIFCDSNWNVLGCIFSPMAGHWPQADRRTKFERLHAPSLAAIVASVTGIPQPYLNRRYRQSFSHVSIAERMSWAAKRTTTRVEDEAYCLLGIFDINMPLLYGEGSKAFARLQHEIVRHTTDKSIFAWTLDPGSGASCEPIFAPSAKFFRRSRIEQWSYDDGRESALTNRGLHIRARSVKVPRKEYTNASRAIGGRSVVEPTGDVFFLLISHTSNGLFENSFAIALAERLDDGRKNQFVRICTDDCGEKFKDMFALDERDLQPRRSFFIDI